MTTPTPTSQRPSWPATWPVNVPPPRRTGRTGTTRPAPLADTDEVSAGNAGFEAAAFTTPEERAEYQRGWRVGVGTGLVAGGLLGALAMASAMWLGVRAALQVM